MFKQTPKKRVLFVRRFTPAVLALFGVFSMVAVNLHSVPVAEAAAANTINFQARLQNANGGIVPDGNYNVEFKLYSASSGGSALWTEDYENSAGHGLKTINGYLTTSLGSITAFSGINWDQQLWLTMNIGGTSTGSVSWDGEMNPRLSLTSVPSAFSANQLASSTVNGRSALNFEGSGAGHGDQNFVIQDQGAAGTYNLLTTSQANAGYIQLQGGSPSAQSGNIDITGNGLFGTSVQTPSLDTASAGTLSIGTSTATAVTVGATNTTGTLTLGQSTASNSINIGSEVITAATQTVNIGTGASGSGVDVVTIGSTNSTSATTINAGSGGIALNGAVTASGTVNAISGYSVNGTAGVTQGVCTTGSVFSAMTTGGLVTGGSCAAVALGPGSTYYIQNGTSPQTADFNVTGTGTASLLQAGNFDTASSAALNIGTTNASSIALKQNTSLASGKTFTANGSGFDASGNLGIGTTTPGANIDVQSGATTGNAVNITANSLTSGSAVNISTNNVGTGNLAQISQTSTVSSVVAQSGNAINVNRSMTVNNTGANPPVTFDAKTSVSLTTSWSHTVASQANRLLIVSCSVSSGIITGVTYNGVAMTSVGTVSNTTSAQVYMWKLIAPATGTHTIVVSGGAYCYGGSTSWYNVDQTTGTGTFVSNTTSGLSTTSVTITSAVDQIVLSQGASANGSQGDSEGAGQINLFGGGSNSYQGSYIAGSSGTTTVSESFGQKTVAIGATNILPAGAPGLTLTGAVGNFSSNCTITTGGCYDSSNILSLSQQYSSATGAVAKLQNAGSGDMIDFLNGSGSTVTSLSSAGNFTTTGTGAFKVTSASAFSVQSASGAATFFNVDTTGTGAITLGNTASGNYISFSASAGLVAYGTAQHGKTIPLTAEYAGAVLDAAGDSSCSAANSGTITSGYDATNYQNYYKWASTTSAQCYDVVVRVTLPSDFVSWSSSTPLTIKTFTANTSTGTINVDAKDTTNAAVSGCAYAPATPASNSTWSTMGGSCNLSTGTYTAGGTITLRIRMTGGTSSDVRIGDMALNYSSKF